MTEATGTGATGVILAAGYSSRMGRFKPLLDFGGVPLLKRQVALFRRAGVEEVLVVTGHSREALLPIIGSEHAREVFNPDFAAGMFSSVLAATVAAPDGPLFFLPVDFPLTPPFLLKLQLAAFAGTGRGVVYSSFDNRKGHPPLVGPELRPAILASDGAGGLQAILRGSETITYVPAWDGRVTADIDTREDYERALALFGEQAVRDVGVCDYLYGLLGTSEDVKNHCAAVGRAAKMLAAALNGRGLSLDEERLFYAGLLHDIKKGTPRHDAAGGALLRDMDYGETAALIAPHMNLPEGEPLGEAAVLYYADKITEGSSYCTLDQRRAGAAARGDKAPYFLKRLEDAARVEGEIRAALGGTAFEELMERIRHG